MNKQYFEPGDTLVLIGRQYEPTHEKSPLLDFAILRFYCYDNDILRCGCHNEEDFKHSALTMFSDLYIPKEDVTRFGSITHKLLLSKRISEIRLELKRLTKQFKEIKK